MLDVMIGGTSTYIDSSEQMTTLAFRRADSVLDRVTSLRIIGSRYF